MSKSNVAAAESIAKDAIKGFIDNGSITIDNYKNLEAASAVITKIIKLDGVKGIITRPMAKLLFNKFVEEYFSSNGENDDDAEDAEDNDDTANPAEEEEDTDEHGDYSQADETEDAEEEDVEEEKPVVKRRGYNPDKPAPTKQQTPPVKQPSAKSSAKPSAKSSALSSKTSTNSAEEFAQSVENAKPNRKAKVKTIDNKKSGSSPRLVPMICNNLNINNQDSPLNVNAKPLKTFPKSAFNLEDAEIELIKAYADEELAEEYTTARDTYAKNVEPLYERYKVKENSKGRAKEQQFTYIKESKIKDSNETKPVVKYIDPDTQKQADLEDENVISIFADYDEAMEDFEKKWKEAIKPPSLPAPGTKPRPSKAKIEEIKKEQITKPLKFLTLDFVRTQNIVSLAAITKKFAIAAEDMNKATNTVLVEVDEDRLTTEKTSPPVFAPDYFQLFNELKSFTGSGYSKLVKAIYAHKDAILNHPKLTEDMKRKCWLQALANIKALDPEKLNLSEEEKLVHSCWLNVLSSKFAYYIVMKGLAPSDQFKKAFDVLIQHELSVRLYETALYPISFIFTPNMLGYNGYEINPKCYGFVSDTTYKNGLQAEMLKFGDPQVKAYDYEDCNWIYWLGKQDNHNLMVQLLHHAVKLNS